MYNPDKVRAFQYSYHLSRARFSFLFFFHFLRAAEREREQERDLVTSVVFVPFCSVTRFFFQQGIREIAKKPENYDKYIIISRVFSERENERSFYYTCFLGFFPRLTALVCKSQNSLCSDNDELVIFFD